MLRKVGLCLMAVLLLAGCDGRRNFTFRSPAGMAILYKDRAENGQPLFSYTHSLSLVLPHGRLQPGFERARDACLNDKALQCELVSASLSSGETGDEASMSVALPHNQMAAFEKILTEGGASVQSRTTNAENVTTQTSDIEHKIAQLTAWRDRLAVLAKRSDMPVTDLLKVEAELSKAEADLAAALTDKRDNDKRVAKELLNIGFSESESALAPIARALGNAGGTLTESTASVIVVLIGIIPWLPLAGGLLLLIRWLARRKKPA